MERDKRQSEADAKRDLQWMDFLKGERAHRAAATARMAEELKVLTKHVVKMTGILLAHDSKANSYINSRLEEDQSR